MTPADALLILHIAAGFFALFSALVAALSVSLHWPFYWHVLSGTVFVVAMSAVFVTAIPLAFLGGSFFLFLIAIFSFYLAFSGWRLAKNRGGTPTSIDWGSGGLMCLSGLVMIGVGVVAMARGNGDGITLAVFGGIGVGLSGDNLRRFRAGGVRGRDRIAQHLTMMLGGTIATVTAFTVTNFQIEPAWVLWLAPTVLLSPMIAFWSARVLSGRWTLAGLRPGSALVSPVRRNLRQSGP
ncbi:MAG: hypothetical protein VYE73_12725 [Acidobacteriota bacterium]|nr:hypothetical protein [Acidobacteriota bacterium]